LAVSTIGRKPAGFNSFGRIPATTPQRKPGTDAARAVPPLRIVRQRPHLVAAMGSLG